MRSIYKLILFFALYTVISQESHIAVINIRGPILMGTGIFVERVVNRDAKNAKAILVFLDTPGGDLFSTQKIVQTFLNSKIPIISYVHPSGASAASAGLFLLMSSNIAAMAPGTSTGAATPVAASGEDIGKDLRKKAVEITSTMARALSEERGRNVEWVKQAVEESKAVTAQEALELKVIDLIANSESELFEKIEGKEIKLGEEKIVLSGLKNLPFKFYEMNTKEYVLEILSNPTVAMVIGSLGTIGILIEFYNPGLIFPGALGVIFLVITLVVNRTITITLGSGLLIISGLTMIIIDIFLGSVLLMVIGALAVFGGLFYYFNPEITPVVFSVDSVSFIPIFIVVLLVLLWVLQGVLRYLRLNQATSGENALIGLTCSPIDEFKNGKGHVFLNGSYWQAKLKDSRSQISKDSLLKVVGTEGLTLIVDKFD